MNRRELLKALPLAAIVPGVVTARERWGAVDIDRYYELQKQGVTLRVIHKGDDVTTQCFFADDFGQGYAKRWAKPSPGHWADEERLEGIQLVAEPFKADS